ncbi:MAG: cysteine desulfurase family protein [Robiginitalea sp.]|jgi:cysteine desulfurase
MYSQLYFDYNATTPCAPEVLQAMLPYFREHFGNPSSSHHPYGWLAKSAVEEARSEIANMLDSSPDSLVFTSGATESINTVLKGVIAKGRGNRNHILTSKAEHKAVLDTCAYLETEGAEVTYLDVDPHGLVRMEDFRQALKPETALVAIMYANNETGVIQPLEEIAALSAGNGSLLFSDTTQALGKVPLHPVLELVDYACFSGHKVYAPKGIGLVYTNLNKGAPMLPSLIQGGGQQKGQRGGTINTPLIVGLARAISLASENLPAEQGRLQGLRDRLDAGLSQIQLAVSNNQSVNRLPNTSHFSFPFVDGANLLNALSRKIAVSNGSACNSASVEPSHVLRAMGVEKSLAYASLRLSIGRYTAEEDIDKAVNIISEAVSRERESNILWERSQ